MTTKGSKANYKYLLLIVILLITVQVSGCTKPTDFDEIMEGSSMESVILKTNRERMLNNRKNMNESYVDSFGIQIEETYYFNQYSAFSADSRDYRKYYPREEDEAMFRYTTYDSIYETALYLDLSAFNLSTGLNLTLKDIEEFSSKEYEDDGTLRFYNNGRHPLIENFVLWALSPSSIIALEEGDYKFTYPDYMEEVTQIIKDYVAEHPEIANFISTEDLETVSWEIVIDVFSLEDADEIMKKYQDPEYELHLSLEGKVE